MGKPKIAFYTLGCKVNQYETQALSEKFAGLGFEIVPEDGWADVYVINSCTVTGAADRKSRNYARRSKRINPDALTALVGCYAQTSPEELSKIEEIDLLMGSAEKEGLPEIVAAALEGREAPAIDGDVFGYGVTGLGGRTRAYLKVEDGCDRFCAYCVIPLARGRVRSRPPGDILSEAEGLLAGGYKELIITGINAALYGVDLEPGLTDNIPTGPDAKSGVGLIGLMEALSGLPGDFRLRLGSLEPNVADSGAVERLLKVNRLCSHLHLSLQSGSDKVLEDMGRRYMMEDFRNIAGILKAHDPDFSITTDLITGFPGESEAEFYESVRAVEEIGFSRVHVFPYSRRKGTRAARMDGQITEAEKSGRAAILAEAGARSAAGFVRRNSGKTRQALILGRTDKGDGYFVFEGITDNGITVYEESETDISNTFRDVVIR